MTPRPKAPIVFAAWTMFVWTTRIGNILRDDSLSDSERTRAVVLAVSFTALALTVVWTWVRRDDAQRVAVLVLAGWTVGVWVTRIVGIVGDDHSAGFVAVHVVLAVVSVTLAALACRHHGPADHRHREAVEQPRHAPVRDEPSAVGDGA